MKEGETCITLSLYRICIKKLYQKMSKICIKNVSMLSRNERKIPLIVSKMAEEIALKKSGFFFRNLSNEAGGRSKRKMRSERKKTRGERSRREMREKVLECHSILFHHVAPDIKTRVCIFWYFLVFDPFLPFLTSN